MDSKGKLDQLNSDVVLQIQKIRNVGAPKDNPESKTAPRLFKLQLTDGNTTYSAIEAETIQAFTMNTAPGTKVCAKVYSKTLISFMIKLIKIFTHKKWLFFRSCTFSTNKDFVEIEKQFCGNCKWAIIAETFKLCRVGWKC